MATKTKSKQQTPYPGWRFLNCDHQDDGGRCDRQVYTDSPRTGPYYCDVHAPLHQEGHSSLVSGQLQVTNDQGPVTTPRSLACAEPGCDTAVHTSASPPVYCSEHAINDLQLDVSATKRKRQRRAARRQKEPPAKPAPAKLRCRQCGAEIDERERFNGLCAVCDPWEDRPDPKGTDDRLNEAGVYVRDVETVRVPLSAGAKRLSAEVRVVEEQSGAWAAAWDEQHGVGSSGCAPSVSDQSRRGYPTRQAAILAMLDAIRSRWNREESSGGTPKTWQRQLQRGIKDLDAFREQFADSPLPPIAQSPLPAPEGRGVGLVPGDPRVRSDPIHGVEADRINPVTTSGPEEFTRRIALAAIGRNRANPRSAVEDAAIAELAESLKTHGMLQPVILRPAAADARLEPISTTRPQGDKATRRRTPKASDLQPPASGLQPIYELVAGERRALAAALAGWPEVPAVIRGLTDEEALELSLVENEQREDLSAIDRARGYRRWLEETSSPRTQKELAAIVGRHHTTVSNTLALLDAPESWQKRVNAGQIPPTFVRHVLPYTDAPKVLEALEKCLDEAAKEKQPIETVADWQRIVKDRVRQKSVPLVKGVHVSQPYAYAELRIDKTHPRYAELQVIDFDSGWRKEKRALNTQLANAILGEKAKAWKAKHGGGAGEGGKGRRGEELVGKAAAKLKAQQDRETHRRQLSDWLDDWKHFLCAQHLHRSASAQQRLALLMHAGDIDDVWENGMVFDRLLDRPPYKVRRPPQQGLGTDRTRSRVWSIPEQQLATVGSEFLSRLLWSEPVRPGKDRTPGPVTRLGRANLDLLCRELSIDLAAEWTRVVDGKQVFAGEPLSEQYVELHTPEQLAELGVEWELWEDDGTLERMGSEELRAMMAATSARRLPLPAELAELIQPAPRKPRSKKKGGAGEGGKGRKNS